MCWWKEIRTFSLLTENLTKVAKKFYIIGVFFGDVIISLLVQVIALLRVTFDVNILVFFLFFNCTTFTFCRTLKPYKIFQTLFSLDTNVIKRHF